MNKTIKKQVIEWVLIFIIVIVGSKLINHYLYATAHVYGNSMLPTFQEGDRLVMDRIKSHIENPKIGDIIIVKKENVRIIKRVVGVEGDKIEIKDGYLYRNGKKIKENYTKEEIVGDRSEITVPKESVYVLGDNRNHSSDSRIYGPFPIEKIEGIVIFELWNNFGKIK